MMKKVKLTKKQIEEALNVAVDVKNRDVTSAVRDAKVQTDKQIGAGKERNYVIAGDELNEDNEPIINPKYTHFVVRKSDGAIVNGYDYNGVDKESAVEYTKEDLIDNNLNPKDFKLLTAKYIMGSGIDPYNEAYWKNFNESKKYTKKQIEEARIKTIKKNNPCFTKKELTEMLKESFDNPTGYFAQKWFSNREGIEIIEITESIPDFVKKLKEMGFKQDFSYTGVTFSKGKEHYTLMKNPR